MPFGVQSDFERKTLPKPEILSYPLETTVIDSVVVNAAGVTPDSSGPYAGRRYLLAGTVLSKRNDNQYERYTAAAGQNVAGILNDTVEFADNSDASDEPVAMLRRNVSFKADKIVDFVANQAAIEAGLPTCEFV